MTISFCGRQTRTGKEKADRLARQASGSTMVAPDLAFSIRSLAVKSALESEVADARVTEWRNLNSCRPPEDAHRFVKAYENRWWKAAEAILGGSTALGLRNTCHLSPRSHHHHPSFQLLNQTIRLSFSAKTFFQNKPTLYTTKFQNGK